MEKAEPMKKYRVQPMNGVQDQPGNVLSSQEITEVNNYDWTSDTDGARESFQNQFVLQLVRGELAGAEALKAAAAAKEGLC